MRINASASNVTILAILLAFAGTLLGLSHFGTASRTGPDAMADARRETRVATVDTSREALAAWHEAGVGGRTLVHLSRFLHFVPVSANDAVEGLDRFPIATFDLPAHYADHVDHANYLWVALQSGMVRSLFHVLPPADLDERLRQLEPPPPGVEVRARQILTSEDGSPRVISDRWPQMRESLLVSIDASFLEVEAPQAVARRVKEHDATVGLIVLVRATDNPDVSLDARRRLDELAALLAAEAR